MLDRRGLLVGTASVTAAAALPSVGAANVQPHAKLKMFWSELRDAGIESVPSLDAPMPDAIERMNAVATRFFGSLPVSFVSPVSSRLVTLYPARLNPNWAKGSDVTVASFPVTIEGMGETAHPLIRMT